MDTEARESTLLWKKKPIPELVRLAWPIAVSMLSYSVMTVTSTLFVGRLGASALAGVSLGGLAAFGLVIFGFGLLRAVKVLVSQATGAGRADEIPAYVAAGVYAALGLGVVALGAGQVLAGFLPAFAATPQAGHDASVYLAMRNLGAPAVLVAVALREARYGVADSRSPLWSALAANVTNLALDALFIIGLDLGVRGAGLAAAIGHVVEAAFLFRASSSPGIGWAAARLRHLVLVVKLGVPLGLQFLLEIGSFAVLVTMLAKISDADLAAHQITLQLTHLSFLPALAIGEAVSVMVGQAVGAGEDGLVKPLARRALVVVSGYSLACGALFVIFDRAIASAFTSDARVQALTVKLLWLAAAFQLFDAANAIARCVLRGTGDVRYPAVIAVLTAWASTPPMTWFLGYKLGWGAVGGWLGLTIEIVVASVILWVRLERSAWVPWAKESRARIASIPEVHGAAEVAAC